MVPDPGRVILAHALQRVHLAASTVTLANDQRGGLEDNCRSLPAHRGRRRQCSLPERASAADDLATRWSGAGAQLTRLLRVTLPTGRCPPHDRGDSQVVHEVPIALTRSASAACGGLERSSSAARCWTCSRSTQAHGATGCAVSARRRARRSCARTIARPDRRRHPARLGRWRRGRARSCKLPTRTGRRSTRRSRSAVDRQNGYQLTSRHPAGGGRARRARRVDGVRARRLLLLRQPDPAQPSRNSQVIDLEVFRHLSLDPRHSRYVHRSSARPGCPGAADDDRRRGTAAAGRPALRGRVALRPGRAICAGSPATRASGAPEIRPRPELLVDVLPDGTTQPAPRPLAAATTRSRR